MLTNVGIYCRITIIVGMRDVSRKDTSTRQP